EGSHGGLELGGRRLEVEDGAGGGPLESTEVGPLAALGARAGLTARQLVDELGERLHGGGEVSRVEGEAGLPRRDLEQRLLEDAALVDAAGDLVPGDAVLRLLREEGVHRGVEASVAGQGS